MSKNDVSKKVEELLKEFLNNKNLSIYKIEYKKLGKEWNLDVYIEKPEGSDEEFVNIEECEMVNRYLSDKLDQADLIPHQYTLSVNSPGLDRELIKAEDFTRYRGRMVELNLYEQLDGVKQFEGVLIGLKDNNVLITANANGKDNVIEIPRNKIAKINLAVVF